MISKKELLNALREAAEFEDKFTPMLSGNILAAFLTLRQSSILPEDKRRIRQLLFELLNESDDERHLLRSLQDEVTKNDKDYF